MMRIQFTATQLRRATELQEQIEALQNELDTLLGLRSVRVPGKPNSGLKAHLAPIPAADPAAEAPKRKHNMSAAGRAAIQRAQKARWARLKAATGVSEEASKRKYNINAVGRAAISRAQKVRWAKLKKKK